MGLDIWTKSINKSITHNLVEMWKDVGIYDTLYRSEGKTASKIIPILKQGLIKLKADPMHYKKFDSPNGWGTYTDAVPWLEDLIYELEKSPRGKIHICR